MASAALCVHLWQSIRHAAPPARLLQGCMQGRAMHPTIHARAVPAGAELTQQHGRHDKQAHDFDLPQHRGGHCARLLDHQAVHLHGSTAAEVRQQLRARNTNFRAAGRHCRPRPRPVLRCLATTSACLPACLPGLTMLYRTALIEETTIMKAAPLVWAGRYSTKCWRCMGQRRQKRAVGMVFVGTLCTHAFTTMPWQRLHQRTS